MTRRITVVDYGIGNLFSVMRALEHVGATAQLTQIADEIEQAEAVILPGVGAFSKGMAGLRERGLVGPLQSYARSGRPLLGICLGMQMLVTVSEEFGMHEGLGLIPGRVVPIVPRGADGQLLKVPHIGWNKLRQPAARTTWDGTILEGTAPEVSTYFVHSFTVVPDNEGDRLADTTYGDCRISASIQSGNVAGCQFHPERSAAVGLRILEQFVEAGVGG